MAGGMFAGHDQSGGEIVEENGKKFKLFYGMSSATAMEVNNWNYINNCEGLFFNTTFLDFLTRNYFNTKFLDF